MGAAADWTTFLVRLRASFDETSAIFGKVVQRSDDGLHSPLNLLSRQAGRETEERLGVMVDCKAFLGSSSGRRLQEKSGQRQTQLQLVFTPCSRLCPAWKAMADFTRTRRSGSKGVTSLSAAAAPSSATSVGLARVRARESYAAGVSRGGLDLAFVYLPDDRSFEVTRATRLLKLLREQRFCFPRSAVFRASKVNQINLQEQLSQNLLGPRETEISCLPIWRAAWSFARLAAAPTGPGQLPLKQSLQSSLSCRSSRCSQGQEVSKILP